MSEIGDDAQAPGTASETEPAADRDEIAGPLAGRHCAVAMVLSIEVALPNTHAVVTLREVDDPHRLFAIPVGVPDATSLAYVWRGVATPRPLTHQLFADVLVRLGTTIDAVWLTGRRAGVVLAELELSSPRGHETVPCRPTDALTLALRQGVPAPILVDERLFDSDGDVEPGQ
ncbi:MAG: bifunctional nuclease family protein [Acidimicrobiales bacterium]